MPGDQKFKKNAKIYLFCWNWAVSADVGQSTWGDDSMGELFLLSAKKSVGPMCGENCTSDQMISESL